MRVTLIGVVEDGAPRRAGVPDNPRANINFIKGSDADIVVTVVTSGGIPVKILPPDMQLVLTLKKRPVDEPKLVRAATCSGNVGTFVIYPADTRRLDAGLYSYDVWLVDGEMRQTVIPLSPFNLLEVNAHIPYSTGPVPAPGIGLRIKSGVVIASAFSGDPRKATVTFNAPFASSAYAVTFDPVTIDYRYSPSAEDKTAAGFVLNLGSSMVTGLAEVGWHAIQVGE